MYYVMRASAPSLHRESTDSLIIMHILYIGYITPTRWFSVSTKPQSGCSVTGLYQQNAQGTHTLLNRTPYTPKPHPYTPKLHPYTPKPHILTLHYYSSWAYAIGGAFDF